MFTVWPMSFHVHTVLMYYSKKKYRFIEVCPYFRWLSYKYTHINGDSVGHTIKFNCLKHCRNCRRLTNSMIKFVKKLRSQVELLCDINAICCDTEQGHYFISVKSIEQDVWFPSLVDYFNDAMKFDTIDSILWTFYCQINDNKNNTDLDLYQLFYFV